MIGKFQSIQTDPVNQHTQQRQCDIQHMPDRRDQQSRRDQPHGNITQIEAHPVETSGDARPGKGDSKQSDITQYISETANDIKGKLEYCCRIFPIHSAQHDHQQARSVEPVHEFGKFSRIDDQPYREKEVAPDNEHPSEIGYGTAPVTFAYGAPDPPQRKLTHRQNKAEKLDVCLLGGTRSKIAETLQAGYGDLRSRNGG